MTNPKDESKALTLRERLKVMGQSVFHEHDDPASTTPEVWRDINEAVALDLLSQLSEAQGKVREMEARLAASGLHVRGLQKSFDELRSKTDSWAANQAEIEQQLGVAAGPHGATLRDWRDLIAKVRQESEAQLASARAALEREFELHRATINDLDTANGALLAMRGIIQDVFWYEGGADSPLDDPYIADRTREALTNTASAAEAAAEALVNGMVDRFCGWPLPEDFGPDCGITFKRDYNENTPWPQQHHPTGTNLFTATQAKAMFIYCLNRAEGAQPE